MKIERQGDRKTQSSGKPRPASPRQWPLPARHSLALTPTNAAEKANTFLIANLELEFISTYRKHSSLRLSNRKFSRFFHPDSALNFRLAITHHSPLGTSTPALATASLIFGSAIKHRPNPQGFNNVQFSNRR
jgi:hypothetical protein